MLAAQTASPLLVSSTFLGGNLDDYAYAVTTDADGNTYLAGETLSKNFPAKPIIGAVPTATNNCYVAKLSPDGKKVVWNVFLGGASNTHPNAVALDPAGNLWVTGRTGARDFPLLKPVQDKQTGLNIVFLTKISPEGKLLFSTYFGGERNDEANAMAIDSEGNVIIGGRTNSVQFPMKNAIETKNGYAFLAKFSNDGQLFWSTRFGGTNNDEIFGVATGPDNTVYVTGETSSVGLGTEGAWIRNYIGISGFAARVAAEGDKLMWFSYVGGRPGYTTGLGITVDWNGNPVIVGHTSNKELPVTAGAVQPKYAGGFRDGFLLKLAADGSQPLYLSYLGGSFTGSKDPDDVARAVKLDSHGFAYVAGTTMSSDMTMSRAMQLRFGGKQDNWVVRVDMDNGRLVSSSYWGGADTDDVLAVALGPEENVTFVGQSFSTDFKLQDAAQAAFGGKSDATITRFCDPWLAAARAEIVFTYRPGDALPEAQDLDVFDGCSNVKHDLASAITGAEWAAATPDRGAMPARLQLKVNVNGLTPGDYETTLILTVNEAANGPLTIPVKLKILEPPSPSE